VRLVDVLALTAMRRGDTGIYWMQRWYYLVFLGCSIAGIATSGYFYCFHLLHIIDNNDLLKRVLQSVTKNGRALLWVAALGIILLYVFAIVEFAFYRESFVNLDNAYCDTLWQCFVSTLDLGAFRSVWWADVGNAL